MDFNRISSILFHLSQQLSLGEAKVYAGTGMGRHTVLHMLARHNIFEKLTQAPPSVIEAPVQSLINQHQNNANKFNRVLVLDSFNNCVPPVQTMHATVAAIPNSFASLNQHREQLNGAGQAITVLNKEGAVVHESIHALGAPLDISILVSPICVISKPPLTSSEGSFLAEWRYNGLVESATMT